MFDVLLRVLANSRCTKLWPYAIDKHHQHQLTEYSVLRTGSEMLQRPLAKLDVSLSLLGLLRAK